MKSKSKIWYRKQVYLVICYSYRLERGLPVYQKAKAWSSGKFSNFFNQFYSQKATKLYQHFLFKEVEKETEKNKSLFTTDKIKFLKKSKLSNVAVDCI